MDLLNSNLLSILIALPLVGAIFLSLINFCDKSARTVALATSLTVFGLSLFLLAPEYSALEYKGGVTYFMERHSWIPLFGITYSLGIDGISLWLVMLTTFLMPLVIISSASVTDKVRGYLISMLVLESAMLGTLVALDMFLFYLFWELMLAPMYFIIGIWGGKRRIYATLKFVLYTVIGSLLMLAAILYTVWGYYNQYGALSFNISDLVNTRFTFIEEVWLFAAFALAFCIKVPLFPFHTWLPDAHVEAPTGGSVVLAGVLLKMGLYGLIRFAYPLFPRAAEAFAPYIAILAVIGIIYGALVAWVQDDMKKLVAYSSVSHLGYCVLGFVSFNSVSISGSIYQMLNHGITTPALFLLVGVLYDQRHTRLIAEYGGIAKKVPVYAFLLLVFTMSSIALPLTNGFVGEFMILLGSFGRFPILVAVSTLGVILGAVYMLTLYKEVMFGAFNSDKNGELEDVNSRELVTLIPLFVLVFVMGLFPNLFLSRMEPSIKSYISFVDFRRRELIGISNISDVGINLAKNVSNKNIMGKI